MGYVEILIILFNSFFFFRIEDSIFFVVVSKDNANGIKMSFFMKSTKIHTCCTVGVVASLMMGPLPDGVVANGESNGEPELLE